MGDPASSEGYLLIGGQPWRLRRLETIAPDVLFDVDVRLDWGRENAIIYTQAALLHSLAPVVSAAEMEQLSEHEAALVLEHVLSSEINAAEQADFGAVAIQRIFFDAPASFMQLSSRARDEATTVRAEVSNGATRAVVVICLQSRNSVERFQTFLMNALSASPDEARPLGDVQPPDNAHSVNHAKSSGEGRSPPDPQTPDSRPSSSQSSSLPRVAIGPALLDSKEFQSVEPGDLIELNLPSTDAMDAVLIDPNGQMIRVIMQNGLLASQESSSSSSPIDQASGVYFEFAHAHPTPDGMALQVTPFDKGLVNVLDKGKAQMRGRFMLEQNRLAFIVDLIEPKS